MSEGVTLSDAPLLGTLRPVVQERLVAAAVPITLPAQEWLFHEGDSADRVFLVVSGRLRVVVERDGEQKVARLLGPGAAIGELAVLTGARRSASIQAIRDSELLEIESERFLELLASDPELSIGLTESLARQLQASGGLSIPDAPPTVYAVAPAPGVVVGRLWDELRAAFSALGPTAAVERPDDDGDGWSRELGELEARHAYVLMLAPPDDGDWRSFCLRQADRVLFVATTTRPKDVPGIEGCDLAFLGTPEAATIAAWREVARPRALHVLPPGDELAVGRVARRLAGRSLGVVLSGGGARAFAHIGVLEVLERAGFVIDRVGGTSMGAFVSAMVACGWTTDTMLEVCRNEVMRRAPFSDYTVPRHSLIRARRAEAMLRRLFGDASVEEQGRPLFTVSADLLSGRMVVHREGPLVEAVGSSMAIPGLAPPVSYGKQLLIDGGVLNNLPIDLMVSDEPGPVLAVDVMRRVDVDELNKSSRETVPTILEILTRATVLGSVERAEASRALAQLVIAPDVHGIALRDFRHLDRAVEAGRKAAEEALAEGADALRAALTPSRATRPAVVSTLA